MKKVIKIFGIVMIIFVIIFILYFTSIRMKIDRGDLVEWDGRWYTREEIQEKYGPQVYQAEAKNTPEEVYETFRQAMLDKDYERALGLIINSSKDRYFNLFKNKDVLKIYENLPTVKEIIKSDVDSYNNFSSYYYKEVVDDIEKNFSIEFIKNKDGYWEIDKI